MSLLIATFVASAMSGMAVLILMIADWHLGVPLPYAVILVITLMVFGTAVIAHKMRVDGGARDAGHHNGERVDSPGRPTRRRGAASAVTGLIVFKSGRPSAEEVAA